MVPWPIQRTALYLVLGELEQSMHEHVNACCDHDAILHDKASKGFGK